MITDYEKLIPEGEYEFIIKTAEFSRNSNTGTVSVYIPAVVRNDVDGQEYTNDYIYHRIYKKKEPNKRDLDCEGYNADQINAICKAVGIPPGKKYQSLSDLFPELINGVFKAKVYHEQFNGKPNAKIGWPEKSAFPDCRHVWKEPQYKQSGINIYATEEPSTVDGTQVNMEVIDTDDDLPF